MDTGSGRAEDTVRIESLDLVGDAGQIRLAAEIAALANTDGGRVVVGIAADAEPMWTHAVIDELIDRLLAPDQLDLALSVTPVELPRGRAMVEIDVPRCPNPPVVLTDGGPLGHHVVLVRRLGRPEPARRADYLHWRDEVRRRVLHQLQMVVDAPETDHVRVVGGDEVRDEPRFLLSRAVDLFRQRPEKLLDGDDLLYLFRHRDSIDLGADGGLAADLLIHSALRRRPTLFFWLALIGADQERVGRLLTAALDMSDRDKSDMGSAVPLVAALYLDDAGYDAVIEQMARSRYAHVARAAKEWPTLAGARAAIDERRRAEVEGRPLARFGDDELVGHAHELAVPEQAARASRRMPNLGLEYLARRLVHRSRRAVGAGAAGPA